MKKILFALVLTISAMFVFAGGQQGGAQSVQNVAINRTGMPIVNQKITYHMVAPSVGDTTYNEKGFYQELEADTNIHIEWEEVDRSVWVEKVQLIMASRDLPDAVYGLVFDSNIVQQMGTEKLIIPLQDLIREWAPNIQKVFDDNDSFKKANTFLDGKNSINYVFKGSS